LRKSSHIAVTCPDTNWAAAAPLYVLHPQCPQGRDAHDRVNLDQGPARAWAFLRVIGLPSMRPLPWPTHIVTSNPRATAADHMAQEIAERLADKDP